MGVLFKHINTGAIKSVENKDMIVFFDGSVSWVKVDKDGNPIERGASTASPPQRPLQQADEPEVIIKKVRPA